METTITTARGEVTIRTGTDEDAAPYRALRLDALRHHPEVFSTDYAEMEGRPMSYWVERLRRGGTPSVPQMLFAAHGGELLGLCGIFVRDSPRMRHSAELISLYVRPAWRGLGVGQALVMACLEWARAHGVRIVKLAVVTSNAGAIRLYERCGFQAYGTEPQAFCYEGVCYDELLMARMV